MKYLRITNNEAQCILQADESHRQAQIKLMGRIYSESELIIIAAAGNSSNYGLPGVSITTRQIQGIVELDPGVDLIETINPTSVLANSTWATRGWTYQEGYLATRRLVFTDSEVLYVCGQGEWQESVQQPTMDFRGYCLRDSDIFPNTFCSDNNNFGFLSNYSARNLSFESDIFNACIGVLEKVATRHFWGMAAIHSRSSSRYQLCLQWISFYPGQRREGFPTWSWVATTGPKSMLRSSVLRNIDFLAEIRSVDGRWLTLEKQTESRYDTLPEDYGATLRLTGTFYTASLITSQTCIKFQYETELEEDPKWKTVLVFQHADVDGYDIDIAFEVRLDSKPTDSVLRHTVLAVPVQGGIKLDGSWIKDEAPNFVILQAVGDHYRRLGVTYHECWTSDNDASVMRWMKYNHASLHPDCRSNEEVIYIE
jgi:hypothetical protein